MNWQLTLDDRAEPYPPPAHRLLTARQRDLLRWVRRSGETRTLEANMFFADAHGAMRRLERAGLIEHVKRGWWRATATKGWG